MNFVKRAKTLGMHMSAEGSKPLTGGQAIVKALVAEGVEAVFGIPGVHNLPIYDALADQPQIRRITTRHEAGASFMADGYARSTGKVGVCIAAAGPGVINTLAGVGTSYVDSVPVMLFASQIPSTNMNRDLGELHDVKDQLSMVEQVTGWSTSIASPENAGWAVHEGMKRIRGMRPRPVGIQVPIDILSATAEVPETAPVPVSKAAAPAEVVKDGAALVDQCKDIVILVGGGAVDAGPEVIELAERLRAQVICTSMGLGTVPDDHPLSLGGGFDLAGTLEKRLGGAELVIAIGTRFTFYTTKGRTLKLGGKLLQIDIDAAEVGKHFRPDVALIGDAATVLRQLLSSLKTDGRGVKDSLESDIAELRERGRQALRDLFPLEMGLAEAVRRAVPRDGIMAMDMTGLAYWLKRNAVAYQPRTVLYPVIFGTLGYALPASIGAQIANPDKKVVAICGDAGFQFSVQELATAVQYGLHFPIVIVNDHGYSAIRNRQKRWFKRAVEGELKNPDFQALARAYGCNAENVPPEGLEEALKRAFASDRMTIIEVNADLTHPEGIPARLAEVQKKAAQ